jgi:hypothetical protein
MLSENFIVSFGVLREDETIAMLMVWMIGGLEKRFVGKVAGPRR